MKTRFGEHERCLNSGDFSQSVVERLVETGHMKVNGNYKIVRQLQERTWHVVVKLKCVT